MPRDPRSQRRLADAASQTGSSLILVLIVLAIVLVGSAMLMRSTESATLIVGNTTFKDSAVRSGELGINAAFDAIRALPSEEVNVSPWYFASAQATDSSGMPSSVNWASVTKSTLGNYQVQWVVDRLCVAPLPVTDTYSQCQVSQTQQTGSNRGGWGVAIQNDPVKYFRVTVRITGPKSTEQFIQSLVSR
jgi:Tfp pilus assembly protein PilX